MSKIYLNINNEQAGPFDVDQVNQMLAQGQATPETTGWMEGMQGWEAIGSSTFSALGVGASAQQTVAPSNPVAPNQAKPVPQAQSPEQAANVPGDEKSPKGFVPTLLLCLLIGTLGIHRFYVGKIGTGIAMIFTCGGLGIWSLIDLIMIAMGKFTDAEGRIIKN